MNKLVKILGVVAVVAVVGAAAWFFLFNKKTETKEVKVDTAVVVATPLPTATVVPATPTGVSKYTAEFRAKARSSFIANCKLKVGAQYATACECGANYLAAHYTDTQLEKAYIEYHSGTKVPAIVQTAYDACKDK